MSIAGEPPPGVPTPSAECAAEDGDAAAPLTMRPRACWFPIA
jgi:hypothetical protein